MRNFLRPIFTRASRALSRGIKHYPGYEYLPSPGEATLLFHPVDSDPRSLFVWLMGVIHRHHVSSIHCSLIVNLRRAVIYEYTMDGVLYSVRPYRPVTWYFKFKCDPQRAAIINYRAGVLHSSGSKIHLATLFSFLWGKPPNELICTSFVNWVLYDDTTALTLQQLLDKVRSNEQEVS